MSRVSASFSIADRNDALPADVFTADSGTVGSPSQNPGFTTIAAAKVGNHTLMASTSRAVLYNGATKVRDIIPARGEEWAVGTPEYANEFAYSSVYSKNRFSNPLPVGATIGLLRTAGEPLPVWVSTRGALVVNDRGVNVEMHGVQVPDINPSVGAVYALEQAAAPTETDIRVTRTQARRDLQSLAYDYRDRLSERRPTKTLLEVTTAEAVVPAGIWRNETAILLHGDDTYRIVGGRIEGETATLILEA